MGKSSAGLIKKRDNYFLWYEYLKANEFYREFLEFLHQSENNSLILTKKITPTEWKNLPDLPQKLVNYKYLSNFYEVFSYWGDIQNISFDDKFDYFLFQLDMNYQREHFRSIQNISIVSMIDKIIQAYKKNKGREPNLQQIKDYILAYEKNKYLLSLEVPVDPPLDDLIKQFKNLVIERKESFRNDVKKKPAIPKLSKDLNKRDLKCLWRYLKVWKLVKSGKEWLEIYKKIDPKKKIYNPLNPGKQLKDDYKNAEEIINNVAKNIFPGPHGEAERQRKRKNRTISKKSRLSPNPKKKQIVP